MAIDVKKHNGNRFGEFDLGGIRGKFPSQAYTSTNLNHVIYAGIPNFDFKTKFFVIIERFPLKLLTDVDYRQRRASINRRIINNNGKINLFVPNGVKSTLRMTKDTNFAFMRFQINCGFRYITVFVKNVRNAENNIREYRRLLPTGAILVVVLDLNLSHDTFRLLHENEIRNRAEIIGFLGRGLSKSNRDNQANFNYIGAREDDNALRVVVAVSKNNDGIVNSLVYKYFGFDVYAFLTRYGNPNAPRPIIVALKDFKLVPLEQNKDLRCVLTGNSLYDSSVDFERRMEKSTLPVSIHDIVRLNEVFEDLHYRLTKQQLEVILEHRIRF